MKFAPLHIVSCFSFLSSGLTIERISRSIIKNDYFGAGITDRNVMYGVPMFITALEKISKPFIVGIELTVDEDNISLFALDEEGYRNISFISTIASQNPITLEFLKDYGKGIACILDTNKGKFKELFLNSEKVDSSFTFRYNKFAKLFTLFYLGVEVTSREEVRYANKIRNFAYEYTYETIAFPTILYEKKDDAIVLTMVDAIKNDLKIDTKKATGQSYFMKEEDYAKIYSPKEMKLTIDLIKKSTFKFHQKRGELLHFPVEDSKQYLRDQVAAGLMKKGLAQNVTYLQRANREVETIIKMGYADYFLIVQDYVNFAINNGILVGSGRGSAAGSLVAYALGITNVDPIKYDLLFERFLNEGRKTMPDIDIDFMDIRRDELVEYVRHKYGANRVANIVTFQTIGAKQSLRDVGRIYGYHDWLIDNLSKAITNPSLSLRECYKTLPAFKALVDSDQYYLEIVSLASKLEGMPRQSGQHAAGVILNNFPIEEAMPMAFDFEDNYISQYEMHYLEEQGFLKMDFLSLRNLTIVDICLKLIAKTHNIIIPFSKLPYEDDKIFEIIRSGKVMGLFQLESAGMKRAAKTLEPTCFDDVVALISLFRPGPMEYIPTYGKRKKGLEKTTYISEEVKKILGPTYGILVYQEQVSTIAQVMAGFSLVEADLFRRGVAKKDAKVLGEQKEKFIQGSLKNGYTLKQATQMYNDIFKFANYGFNKSHAVGYAILGCQMAYLKAYYPLEFYASILQASASTNDVKFNEIVREMRSLGLNVSLPDINKSELLFTIDVENNTLIYPLSEIRGINSILATNIIEEKNRNGEYTSFFNFLSRIYGYKINEKHIEALISSGAFDSLHPSRASLRASINRGLQYAELTYNENGQLSLDTNLIQPPSIISREDNALDNLNAEYETIGIMLSGSPFSLKKHLLEEHKASTILEAQESTGTISFGGLIRSKKVINTKKGTPMAFVKLSDELSEIEVIVFSDAYTKVNKYLEINKIVIVTGNRKMNKGESTFIVQDIIPLED